MRASQENMQRAQDDSYEFGGDGTPSPQDKRQRFNSDDNTTPNQHTYASSHQPVRTPEDVNSSFPVGAPYNAAAVSFPSSGFDFKHPIPMPPMHHQYEGLTSTNDGGHSQGYRQMQGNYGHSSQSVFDAPHQPHGLVGYPSSSMQPGIREEQEAAGNLQALAVQSGHGPENGFPGYDDHTQYDPALEIIRPKGRYEERVDNHMQHLKSTKEVDTSTQQYQHGQSYLNDHFEEQQQHHGNPQ
jgi:hypothetical protein